MKTIDVILIRVFRHNCRENINNLEHVSFGKRQGYRIRLNVKHACRTEK